MAQHDENKLLKQLLNTSGSSLPAPDLYQQYLCHELPIYAGTEIPLGLSHLSGLHGPDRHFHAQKITAQKMVLKQAAVSICRWRRFFFACLTATLRSVDCIEPVL